MTREAHDDRPTSRAGTGPWFVVGDRRRQVARGLGRTPSRLRTHRHPARRPPLPGLHRNLGAIAFYDVPALVRVPSIDPADIGRALDLGAAGIMAPLVNDAEDARLAALSCRYAPDGIRSYGMQTPRIDPFADDYRPLCAVQIETAAAVANIDEIAAVEGVDWLYVGPADLGLSIGGVPAPDVISVFDGSHPLAEPMQTAFSAVVEAARNHGKLAGLHCGSGEAALQLLANGFQVSAVATDLVAALRGMAHELEIARGASGQPDPADLDT